MRLRPAFVVLLLIVLPVPASAAAPFAVRQVRGHASLQHRGVVRAAVPGVPVVQGDVLTTAAGAALELDLAGHGSLRLQGESSLAVERLPFAAWAPDLLTVLNLLHGGMRLRWSYPRHAAGVWPLLIYVGPLRALLGRGAFGFARDTSRTRVCVLSGRLRVAPLGPPVTERVAADGCRDFGVSQTSGSTALHTIQAPEELLAQQSPWVTVPRSLDLPQKPPPVRTANGAGR
jgi:hypothetical protein